MQCSCMMMPQMRKIRRRWHKCSRGKGNKNKNKNAFSLPRSQIAECRPHHHNRITTKKKKQLYVFVHRGEMKCAHRIVWKLKILLFSFKISNQIEFHLNFLRTRKNSWVWTARHTIAVPIHHLTVEAKFVIIFFSLSKRKSKENFLKCLNFLQKFKSNAFFFSVRFGK